MRRIREIIPFACSDWGEEKTHCKEAVNAGFEICVVGVS